MKSTVDLIDDDHQISVFQLPVFISNNPREQLVPEQVDLPIQAKLTKKKVSFKDVIYKPVPRHTLALIWSPDILEFNINDFPIERKLRVWNACHRPIYLHYCGIWNYNNHNEVGWRCHPKTRLFLAPGLNVDLSVSIIPHKDTNVPSAKSTMQLATSHLRDNVVGYFSVPIQFRFLNYVEIMYEDMIGENP